MAAKESPTFTERVPIFNGHKPISTELKQFHRTQDSRWESGVVKIKGMPKMRKRKELKIRETCPKTNFQLWIRKADIDHVNAVQYLHLEKESALTNTNKKANRRVDAARARQQ